MQVRLMKWILISLIVLIIIVTGLLFMKISLRFHLKILPEDKRLTLVAYFGFLPVFRRQIDFSRIVENEEEWAKVEKKAEEIWKDKVSEGKVKRSLSFSQVMELGRVITVHKMDSIMRVGTGMASSTGSLAGGLMALGTLLEQLLDQLFTIKKPAKFRVEPSFQMPCFHVLADGIFSFRLGKAIYVWLRYVNRKAE